MMIRQVHPENVLIWKNIRLEAIKLHPEAFGGSFEEESQQSDADFASQLEKNVIFAAFENGEIGGCVGFFSFQPLKLRHRGTLFSMYVKQAQRGTGLSDQLVQTVLNYAHSRVRQVHYTVVTTNETAKRLYERHGFVVYGTEPRSLRIGPVFYDEHLMVNRLVH